MFETDKLMCEHELTPEDYIIMNDCNSRQQNSTQLFYVNPSTKSFVKVEIFRKKLDLLFPQPLL